MYDPKREFSNHKKKILNSIQTVLEHGLFINGPEVSKLEQTLQKFTNTEYCIAVSNGTDALLIALLALDIGIDDEVITVAHTWISTAEVISLIHAKPVFVDIESKTFNIDITKLEEKITSKTKAIIVVSLYGQMPDFDKINEIAKKYNLHVIEDGAQSFGAQFKNRKSCSLTTIGTTSFFPSKPLGCYGDGGACFTNDSNLAIKMKAIKEHGGIKRFSHKYIGLNARLDSIQAAILLHKISYFEDTIKKRIACAEYYSSKIKLLGLDKFFRIPIVNKDCISVWAQYSLLANNKTERDNVVMFLKENKVNISIFYPIPIHYQECFKMLKYKKGDLPITEQICDTIFNLPCYDEFTHKEQDLILELLQKLKLNS